MNPVPQNPIFEQGLDLRSWSKVLPGPIDPSRIKVLRAKRKKRSIYRLEGVGHGGTSVIVKRCRTATASIERIIYEEVLPELPLSSPRFYGCVEEDGGYSCLFLEDVGDKRFSPLSEEQRRLAARWLGVLHTLSLRIAPVDRLPKLDSAHHLEQLRSGQRNILENLANPSFATHDVALLKGVSQVLDTVAAHWTWIEKLCEELPSTLVHSDFRPKNVYVRTVGAATRIFPTDWETAGWGVLAPDLAGARSYGSLVDFPTYQAVVREYWPGLDLSMLGRCEMLGKLFRRIAAVRWSSLSLSYENPDKALACMRVYRQHLLEVLETPPWR